MLTPFSQFSKVSDLDMIDYVNWLSFSDIQTQ